MGFDFECHSPTVTNVNNGATSPIAGVVHALTLLAVVVLAAPWAVHIPLAALAGILIAVDAAGVPYGAATFENVAQGLQGAVA